MSSLDFGSHSYWEKRYGKLEERKKKYLKKQKSIKYTLYEWYQDWDRLNPIFEKHLAKPHQNLILNVGCGNSTLGESLWLQGLGTIFNIDYSESVIYYMQERFESLYMIGNEEGIGATGQLTSECTYSVMDATKTEYCDCFFDVVIDKGTLDALICGTEGKWQVCNLVCELGRILKTGGFYFLVTHGKLDERQPIFSSFQSWKLEAYYKLRNEPNFLSAASTDYVYILRKN